MFSGCIPASLLLNYQQQPYFDVEIGFESDSKRLLFANRKREANKAETAARQTSSVAEQEVQMKIFGTEMMFA